MIGRRGRLFAAGLTLAALVGCQPIDGAPRPQPPPLPVGPTIDFVVRAYNGNAESVSRPVFRILTAVDAKGRFARVTDLETGKPRPTPWDMPLVKTPVRHRTTLLPGVVAVSMSVRMTGGRKWDIIACWVERDGAEVPGTRDATQQTATAVVGGVKANCVYP